MDSVDLTKLIGGGGVGLVLLVALFHFLKHLEKRDEHEARRSEAFLAVTSEAVATMSRFDARAGVVVAAVERLGDQVRALDDRLARIEDGRHLPPPPGSD